jgi:microcystin-dependent protein
MSDLDSVNSVATIFPTECIGNSLNTINTNFKLLKDGSNEGYSRIQILEQFCNLFVGTVSYFLRTTAPNGWLELDGSLRSRTDYDTLWSFAKTSSNIVSDSNWFTLSALGSFSYGDGNVNTGTTFRLPNLKGSFIRGFGTQDTLAPYLSSGDFGRYQKDTLGPHTHAISLGTGTGGQTRVTSLTSYQAGTPTTGLITDTTPLIETRPRNIALLPCIYTGLPTL